jgi:hypothetical protein
MWGSEKHTPSTKKGTEPEAQKEKKREKKPKPKSNEGDWDATYKDESKLYESDSDSNSHDSDAAKMKKRAKPTKKKKKRSRIVQKDLLCILYVVQFTKSFYFLPFFLASCSAGFFAIFIFVGMTTTRKPECRPGF